MTIDVKIIEDSISDAGARITTFQLRYPRFIHSEIMTHRVLSRNASSSRAIPLLKSIENIFADMAVPVHWGKNKPGMQATEELSGFARFASESVWKLSGYVSCGFAYLMSKCGTHKQIANRIIEPWSHISVVLTATEFDNFFELRCHADAQPEFRELACRMRNMLRISVPVNRQYHLPYVSEQERIDFDFYDCIAMSAARCARVSYLLHDGTKTSYEKDFELYDKLVKSTPRHCSPVEHQAIQHDDPNKRSRNFVGWLQARELLGF